MNREELCYPIVAYDRIRHIVLLYVSIKEASRISCETVNIAPRFQTSRSHGERLSNRGKIFIRPQGRILFQLTRSLLFMPAKAREKRLAFGGLLW